MFRNEIHRRFYSVRIEARAIIQCNYRRCNCFLLCPIGAPDIFVSLSALEDGDLALVLG